MPEIDALAPNANASRSRGIIALTFAALTLPTLANSELAHAVDQLSPPSITIPGILTDYRPLTDHKHFANLTEKQKESAIRLYDCLPEAARTHLVNLLDRTLSHENNIPALISKDFHGTTLLSTLHEIEHAPMAPALESQRDEIMTSFLQELCCPGELNQASWGVCGTSLLYELYLKYPGEGARLMQGLLSEKGAVPLLRKNAILTRAPYALLPDQRPGRSVSERIIMSAFMEYADGNEFHYCTVCDQHFNVNTGESNYRGLRYGHLAYLYKGLYDKEYAYMQHTPGQRGNTPETLYHSITQRLPEMVQVAIEWRTSEQPKKNYGRHVIGSAMNTQSIDSNHLQGTHESTASTQKVSEYHYLHVLKIEGDRVYFHNLHGPTDLENKTELENPPRRVEDNTSGIESMNISEFKRRLRLTMYPTSRNK